MSKTFKNETAARNAARVAGFNPQDCEYDQNDKGLWFYITPAELAAEQDAAPGKAEPTEAEPTEAETIPEGWTEVDTTSDQGLVETTEAAPTEPTNAEPTEAEAETETLVLTEDMAAPTEADTDQADADAAMGALEAKYASHQPMPTEPEAEPEQTEPEQTEPEQTEPEQTEDDDQPYIEPTPIMLRIPNPGKLSAKDFASAIARHFLVTVQTMTAEDYKLTGAAEPGELGRGARQAKSPAAPKESTPKETNPATAAIIRALMDPDGATMDEIQKAAGWDNKPSAFHLTRALDNYNKRQDPPTNFVLKQDKNLAAAVRRYSAVEA